MTPGGDMPDMDMEAAMPSGQDKAAQP